MVQPLLKINKSTRKLWRLQTLEKYKVNRLSEISFEVFTEDLKLKAYVDVMGALYQSSVGDNYNKVNLYKLKNYCNLLLQCHFGLTYNN